MTKTQLKITIDKLAEIITAAQAQAAKAGFTKEWDRAIAFRVALDEAGYKIVRKPKANEDKS